MKLILSSTILSSTLFWNLVQFFRAFMASRAAK